MESELQLRKMVDSYSERYSSLTGSIAQSNEAFDKMKKEMSKVCFMHVIALTLSL